MENNNMNKAVKAKREKRVADLNEKVKAIIEGKVVKTPTPKKVKMDANKLAAKKLKEKDISLSTVIFLPETEYNSKLKVSKFISEGTVMVRSLLNGTGETFT